MRLLNGTKAAIEAGYGIEGAAVQAHENLRNPKIQDRLTVLRKERAEAEGIAKEDLLAFFKDVITADIGDLFDEVGKLRNPQDLPDDLRRVIAGVKLNKHGIEMTFVDKKWAAQMLAAHLGMNAPVKIEHSGKIETTESLAAEIAEMLKGDGA